MRMRERRVSLKRHHVLAIAIAALAIIAAVNVEVGWRGRIDVTISSCCSVKDRLGQALQMEGEARREVLSWVASVDVNGMAALMDSGHLSADDYGKLRDVPNKLAEKIPRSDEGTLKRIEILCEEVSLMLREVRDDGLLESFYEHLFCPGRCRLCEAVEFLILMCEV